MKGGLGFPENRPRRASVQRRVYPYPDKSAVLFNCVQFSTTISRLSSDIFEIHNVVQSATEAVPRFTVVMSVRLCRKRPGCL
jgi:hypothetical protein